MKISFLLLWVMVIFISMDNVNSDDFKTSQKRFPRVRVAYSEKEEYITSKLKKVNIALNDLNVLVVAFKAEKQLELWVKSKNNEAYILLDTFKICASSGNLGPKRKQGDFQVPEGFYYIDRFNPASNFHLSLGINYPNKSDVLKSKFSDPGGDIFIHGDCRTVGCLPITDDKIKEIYLYAVEAKNAGQYQIPVYIFPARLNDQTYKTLKIQYHKDIDIVKLWSSIKVGYDQFIENKKEIKFKINDEGDYLIRSNEE